MQRIDSANLEYSQVEKSYNYLVYEELKNTPFASNIYENWFYLKGRFFLLGKPAQDKLKEDIYINSKIVKFILNDKTDFAFHHTYKVSEKEKWYHRVPEHFYVDVHQVLSKRKCHDIAPEVCMALQVVLFKFRPWFLLPYEHSKKVDMTKVRPIRKKRIEQAYLYKKEEQDFLDFMQHTIELCDQERISSTFKSIIFQGGNTNFINFNHGWLKEKMISLYKQGLFNLANKSELKEPNLYEFDNEYVNKHYKHIPAHRMFNLFTYQLKNKTVDKPEKEAIKMIGELYALIGIFEILNIENVDKELQVKKNNTIYKYQIKHTGRFTGMTSNQILKILNWDETKMRIKIEKILTSELHEVRRKNISQWVLKPRNNKRERFSNIDDASFETLKSLFE